MATFEEIRRDALTTLADCCSAFQRIGRNAEGDAVRDARNQLLDGRLTAVTIGEYKRGKSSLVGALVEDPALFPVNVDITTSLITSVEYAAKNRSLCSWAKKRPRCRNGFRGMRSRTS